MYTAPAQIVNSKFLNPNTMTTTVEVKHTVPTTVQITEVSLPFYFTNGKYIKHYCCMTAKGDLIEISRNGGYWHIDVTPHEDADDISNRLEHEFSDEFYGVIDEAVFMHKFSEAHREIFYMVNPQLKPLQ